MGRGPRQRNRPGRGSYETRTWGVGRGRGTWGVGGARSEERGELQEERGFALMRRCAAQEDPRRAADRQDFGDGNDNSRNRNHRGHPASAGLRSAPSAEGAEAGTARSDALDDSCSRTSFLSILSCPFLLFRCFSHLRGIAGSGMWSLVHRGAIRADPRVSCCRRQHPRVSALPVAWLAATAARTLPRPTPHTPHPSLQTCTHT